MYIIACKLNKSNQFVNTLLDLLNTLVIHYKVFLKIHLFFNEKTVITAQFKWYITFAITFSTHPRKKETKP